MGSNINQGLGPKSKQQETLTVSIGTEEYEGAQALAVVGGHNFTRLNYGLSNHSNKLEHQHGRPKKALWQINRDQRERPQSWAARVYDFVD